MAIVSSPGSIAKYGGMAMSRAAYVPCDLAGAGRRRPANVRWYAGFSDLAARELERAARRNELRLKLAQRWIVTMLAHSKPSSRR